MLLALKTGMKLAELQTPCRLFDLFHNQLTELYNNTSQKTG